MVKDLASAAQVLEDAVGARLESLDRSRISVILGVTGAQELLATMVSRMQRPVWVKALRESGLPESQVREICDDAACASTFGALAMAVHELQLGLSDLVISGGVDTLNRSRAICCQR